MRLTSTLLSIVVVLLVCMEVSSLPIQLSKSNWKEHFGCELN